MQEAGDVESRDDIEEVISVQVLRLAPLQAYENLEKVLSGEMKLETYWTRSDVGEKTSTRRGY